MYMYFKFIIYSVWLISLNFLTFPFGEEGTYNQCFSPPHVLLIQTKSCYPLRFCGSSWAPPTRCMGVALWCPRSLLSVTHTGNFDTLQKHEARSLMLTLTLAAVTMQAFILTQAARDRNRDTERNWAISPLCLFKRMYCLGTPCIPWRVKHTFLWNLSRMVSLAGRVSHQVLQPTVTVSPCWMVMETGLPCSWCSRTVQPHCPGGTQVPFCWSRPWKHAA